MQLPSVATGAVRIDLHYALCMRKPLLAEHREGMFVHVGLKPRHRLTTRAVVHARHSQHRRATRLPSRGLSIITRTSSSHRPLSPAHRRTALDDMTSRFDELHGRLQRHHSASQERDADHASVAGKVENLEKSHARHAIEAAPR